MKIYGKVEGGIINYDDKALMDSWLAKNEGREIRADFSRRNKKDRSLEQNSYYWGVLIKLIADEIGEDDHDAIHEFLKVKFLAFDSLFILKFRSTADLSTVEFEDYCAKIRSWAWQFLGVFLPKPNESLQLNDNYQNL